jgi:hypothetical protein
LDGSDKRDRQRIDVPAEEIEQSCNHSQNGELNCRIGAAKIVDDSEHQDQGCGYQGYDDFQPASFEILG